MWWWHDYIYLSLSPSVSFSPCSSPYPEHRILITINKLLRVLICIKNQYFWIDFSKKNQSVEAKVSSQKSISDHQKKAKNNNKKNKKKQYKIHYPNFQICMVPAAAAFFSCRISIRCTHARPFSRCWVLLISFLKFLGDPFSRFWM